MQLRVFFFSFLFYIRSPFFFLSFGDTWIWSRAGCPREGPASGSARGREREGGREGREGRRAGGGGCGGRASLPRREAAALHLWPWEAEEQVTKALPEAGLDQARGTESSGSLLEALAGEKVGRSAPARPGKEAWGNVEPVCDYRLTLML
jgi:hypothetical protein